MINQLNYHENGNFREPSDNLIQKFKLVDRLVNIDIVPKPDQKDIMCMQCRDILSDPT